jgi:hypothetical protein
MQRTRGRQKTLVAHGIPVSDERLPIVVLDTRQFRTAEGRVLVHGQDDDSGRNYLMLEGTDARVHFVYYTPEMEEARSNGEMRTNSFVRLRRINAEGRPIIDVRDFGDAEALLKNRSLLREKGRALIEEGIIPEHEGWGGWHKSRSGEFPTWRRWVAGRITPAQGGQLSGKRRETFCLVYRW